MRLSPGQVVNGKYRVIRLLGDGGMGSVYEVHHEVLGTRVAFKLLHTELSSTGLAKRFLQEARASARIKSPHVVAILDADQTAEGFAFMVLEYLVGKTLRELYEDLDREQRRLPFEDALDFAMQMFEGVEAAHAAGIVHRDLKPDNVMITTDSKGGRLLKLLDFGIAKVDEPPETGGGPALTRPGALLGTPEYMAPEQVYSAGTADAQSDVFSLGVILFEMLSGRRPVEAEDPQQIAVSYLTGAILRLEQICPDVPPALARAVHRAIAPQPRDRFPSVAELHTAVEPFAPVRQATTSRAGGPTTGTARPYIPETRADGSSANAPAGHDHAGATPLASVVAVPPPASGFVPEYPGGVPFSVAPTNVARPPGGFGGAAAPPSATGNGTALMQTGGGTSHMPSHGGGPARTVGDGVTALYPGAAGQPSGPQLAASPSGYMPAPPPGYGQGWAPPAPVDPSLAPRPGSRRTLWIIAAVIAVLVVIGITLGILGYLGYLDAEPEHPHRRPHTTHKPAR